MAAFRSPVTFRWRYLCVLCSVRRNRNVSGYIFAQQQRGTQNLWLHLALTLSLSPLNCLSKFHTASTGFGRTSGGLHRQSDSKLADLDLANLSFSISTGPTGGHHPLVGLLIRITYKRTNKLVKTVENELKLSARNVYLGRPQLASCIYWQPNNTSKMLDVGTEVCLAFRGWRRWIALVSPSLPSIGYLCGGVTVWSVACEWKAIEVR